MYIAIGPSKWSAFNMGFEKKLFRTLMSLILGFFIKKMQILGLSREMIAQCDCGCFNSWWVGLNGWRPIFWKHLKLHTLSNSECLALSWFRVCINPNFSTIPLSNPLNLLHQSQNLLWFHSLSSCWSESHPATISCVPYKHDSWIKLPTDSISFKLWETGR